MASNSSSSMQVIYNQRFWIWKNKFIIKCNKSSTIDKIYLHIKDPYEANYQLLINKWENTELGLLNYSKAFIEYLNDIVDIYKNIEEHNLNKKTQNILIIFDDMFTDMLSNIKRIQKIQKELNYSSEIEN